MDQQISWLGLGNMGRGMVRNIATKANLEKPIIIFNRSAKRAIDLEAELGKEKVTVSESIPDAVAAADIVFTSMSDDKAIEEVLGSILQASVTGKLFVDTSTVHPDTTNALCAKVEAAGAHFVACPVFGAPAMADAGQLICVLAGKREDVARVRPFGKGIIGRNEINFAGQAPGKATLMKVIGNTFVLQMVEALCEGHVLAETSGLGVENLHSWISAMFPGPYTAYSARLLAGDYTRRDYPLWGVDLARKDARHAMALASAAGFRLKAVEVADEHLAAVKAAEGSAGDLVGIYGAIRQEAGLPFDNGKGK